MTKKQPIIGLTSSFMTHEETEKVFLPLTYFHAIRSLGGIPLLIPVQADHAELTYLLDQCDGLVLTGGDDIDPTLYGEEPLNDSIVPAPERDRLEKTVIDMALDRNLPILGICRGIQVLNVYFGGTLWQDIPAQIPSDVAHRMQKPYKRTSHSFIPEPGTPLSQLFGCAVGVNSHHHQAVKDVAPGLKSMGTSEDGLVEALYDPSRPFLWAVQWHPEKIWDIDENSRKLFEVFLKACGA